ncbi:FUSC family protein [Stappia indica]|uniref:FUSC family protein n=1 Tax=Stappia indica TaxID=538381 RepID=UPI001CD65160|nr:FUSC family protein [Stappia indica]MCA1298490.1 FUSC family protein [Stappia indica]
MQAWRDLQPFDGRLAMTWRIALLCALVTGVAMAYHIPEAAISCYLVIFLMKPDAVMNCLLGVGLIGLASFVVLLMIPVINLSIDSPAIRLAIMFFASYVFLFLSSTTPLGEQAAIVGLIIAFIMTLVTDVPVGQIGDQGLLAAWKMACMPMALMVLFNLLLGTPSHTHVRNRIVDRLRAAADALETPENHDRLDELLAEGNDASLQQMLLVKLLHLVPKAQASWLNGAVETSYRIALTAQAPSDTISPQRRAALAGRLRDAAERIAARARPEAPTAELPAESRAERTILEALGKLSQADGGGNPKPVPVPPLVADAFSSPKHQRYALKTSIAAVLCYLIYTAIDWDGIHTALITCYVAALGTTGETVRKLTLRIVGCLVGAAMGVAALLFVMPHLTSVGGLMALVFTAVFIAAWVSSGNERISYAGVQIALAFLLTTLNGFGPSFEFSQAGDRILGILLGIFVIYVLFTQFWPTSIVSDIRVRLGKVVDALGSLAERTPDARMADVTASADVLKTLEETTNLLSMAYFEPRRHRVSNDQLRRLQAIRQDLLGLYSEIRFRSQMPAQVSTKLARLAEELANEQPAIAPAVSHA